VYSECHLLIIVIIKIVNIKIRDMWRPGQASPGQQ
jgi:hypothetical protein